MAKRNSSEVFEKQVDRLVMHYGKFNALDSETVEQILESDQDDNFGLDPEDNKVILHGVGGRIIKAQTLNQSKLVAAMEKSDMVFAVGPKQELEKPILESLWL